MCDRSFYSPREIVSLVLTREIRCAHHGGWHIFLQLQRRRH
ncbi:hypothetical protein Ae717Ps2_6602c [Pseudonocardia sp. Ae717_Ps2]|nr:hypothetical protein Ae717Ps2_6602c [Pseudonocardia sp. Ae717_Ps2]